MIRAKTLLIIGTVLLVAPLQPEHETFGATGREYTVAARLLKGSDAAVPTDLVIKSEGRSARASFQNLNKTSMEVAIILDGGPSQAQVLDREKDLAISIVNGLSDRDANFMVGRVGLAGRLFPRTRDRTVVVRTIQEISGDTGKSTDVAIYDLLGAAIHEMTDGSAIRILIFIGGGKDLGSKSSYKELRNLAEANHVACFVLLVADRSHRGPKSMLSHGWFMRELADETAGIFLENEKTAKATEKVSENIRALRLVIFEMDYKEAGRHEIRLKSTPRLRIRVQKAVFVEGIN
jgi:hypothetical protein